MLRLFEHEKCLMLNLSSIRALNVIPSSIPTSFRPAREFLHVRVLNVLSEK